MSNILNQQNFDPIVVNGRRKWFRNITMFEAVPGEKGCFRGTYRCRTDFRIEGGKRRGGTARDWFLDIGDGEGKSINCSSVMDALRCVDTM